MDRSHGGGRPNRILSTAALFRRQEQAWRLSQPCFIDRSNAVFYRQEQWWRPPQPVSRDLT